MFCMRICYDIYMYTNLFEYIATIWHCHYHHHHLHYDDYDDCAELCDAYDDLLLSLKRVTKSSDYMTQASKRLLLPNAFLKIPRQTNPSWAPLGRALSAQGPPKTAQDLPKRHQRGVIPSCAYML